MVKFDSVKPARTQNGYGSIRYGRYGTVNLEGAGNLQLGNGWSARLFRANIIQAGSNDLVAGFDPAGLSTDGKNHQELETTGGSIRLSWNLVGMRPHAITDWVYRSKVNFFLYESTEFTGKSLLEGGLRVGYNWGNGKYEVAAFGRNIGNQVRVAGASTSTTCPASSTTRAPMACRPG